MATFEELNDNEKLQMNLDEEGDLRQQKRLIQESMRARTLEERAAIQSELDAHRSRPTRNPTDYKLEQV